MLPTDPILRESLITVLIPIVAWLLARSLSALLERLFGKAATRTPATVDLRLVDALEGPLSYALVIAGLYIAIHRLPIAERTISLIDNTLFTAGVVVVAFGALRSYGIFISWYASESRLGAESALAREFGPLLSKVGKLVIGLIALITVLQHLRVDVNSLVVSLGVGSLAVGLAAQDTLSNMFAGFTLMLDRPFRIGDRIQLASGEVGDVEAIGIRATRMRTTDDTLLVIPNATLVKERVVNQSRPTRGIRLRAELRVPHGSDVTAVKRILSEAALSSEHVDRDRPPQVLLTRVAESGMNFQVVCYARDFAEQGLALSDIYEQSLRRLREASIEKAGA